MLTTTLHICEGTVIQPKVTVRVYRDGALVRTRMTRNKITTAYLNRLRDVRLGVETDLVVSHVAWGSGNTAPAAGDTALDTEVGRKVLTDREAGAAGILIDIGYLDVGDANGQIEELGFFIGGTMTPGSGLLAARVLHSDEKIDRESWQIEREETFAEAVP